MLGDLGNKKGVKAATADSDIDAFYLATFIEPKEYLLNSSEDKERRVQMIKLKLDKYNVPASGNVSEFACGTGWLSGSLNDLGYRVTALDRSQDMLEIATKDNPNVTFVKFDWNNWKNWKELKVDFLAQESQDAVIINGRSVRHAAHPYELMSEVSSVLADGGIFMYDSPDVETKGTPQAQKLENNRKFYEQLRFFRPWLTKYSWHMVGAPAGQIGEMEHFIELWTPSRELAILYAEANGLKHVETVVEENYDGQGSNNNYFIFRRVERAREKEFVSNALNKIDDYFANQPKKGFFDINRASYRD